MSLPSGLIFFLDFTFEPKGTHAASGDSPVGLAAGGARSGESVYGGGRVASELTGGVSLTGAGNGNGTATADADQGYRNLNTGYAHATATVDNLVVANVVNPTAFRSLSQTLQADLRHDADLDALDATVTIVKIENFANSAKLANLNTDALTAIAVGPSSGQPLIGNGANQIEHGDLLVRRLTHISGSDLHLVFASTTTADIMQGGTLNASNDQLQVTYPVADPFKASTAVGSVVADVSVTAWPLESEADIPEVDIKVDSIAVTAQTKKLKAHWSPELAQDLNAYHNLDAEVELTSVLSEMIAKEIDNEILKDLVEGALQHGSVRHWSRAPGQFLNLETGEEVTGRDFTGNVSEWNETLLDTINGVSADIHRKTLRGGANFIVCSPEVAAILEFTSGFRANVAADSDKGSWGVVNAGSISGKMDIFVDPGFPRNTVLVGRRGNSFLESGYVYAPYVPLQMTPTVLGVDDFTPRKGVMTRYAKKMVRPDMYGLVLCRNFVLI